MLPPPLPRSPPLSTQSKNPKTFQFAPPVLKSTAKTTGLGNLNTSKRSAHSNERRLQTLEYDSYSFQKSQTPPTLAALIPSLILSTPQSSAVAATTASQSSSPINIQLGVPTSIASASNAKRKLFSNLNNISHKPNSDLYATISDSVTPPSARLSKNYNGDQRRQLVALAKKPRAITNENLHDYGSLIPASKTPTAAHNMDIEDNNDALPVLVDQSNILVDPSDFKKPPVRYNQNLNKSIAYQHQNVQQQHPSNLPHVESNETKSPSNPPVTNINAFITRVAKGEILGSGGGQGAATNTYQTLVPIGSSASQTIDANGNANQQKGFMSGFKEKKLVKDPLKFTRFKKATKPYTGGPVSLEAIPSSSSHSQTRSSSTKPLAVRKPIPNRPMISSIHSTNSPSSNINRSKAYDKKEGLLNLLQEAHLNDSKAIEIEEDIQVSGENTAQPTAYYTPAMVNALKIYQQQEMSYFEQIYKEHFIQSFHSLHFCKKMKPIKKHVLQSKKSGILQADLFGENFKGKKTIVFDLDETLIHCNESADVPSDAVLQIKFPNNDIIDAGINIRPYARECLEQLHEFFEIIVFTASHECYAVKVLEQLDPHRKYISYSLYRDSCVQTNEGVHVKDLRVFANRNLKDLVLVDNAAYSFALQVHNGIPIVPYYYNKEDQELKHLTEYLLGNILHCRDVREINKQYFKMHLYTHEDRIEQAAKLVYQV